MWLVITAYFESQRNRSIIRVVQSIGIHASLFRSLLVADTVIASPEKSCYGIMILMIVTSNEVSALVRIGPTEEGTRFDEYPEFSKMFNL
jgi:hypothetical protein